jgi:ferredoxin
MTKFKVEIDQDKCIGCGMCNGYNPKIEKEVQNVTEQCPVQAIKIIYEDYK